MFSRERGSILITTVVIIAIASIWFTMILVISSNYFKITEDQVARTQSRLLAEGGMNEGIVTIRQALVTDTLQALPVILVSDSKADTAGVGEIEVSWQALNQDQLRVRSEGKSGNSTAGLSGDFKIIAGRWFLAENALPTILLTEQEDYNRLLQQNKEQNAIIQGQRLPVQALHNSQIYNGSIHCRSDAALTVQVDGTLKVNQQLLVEGDLLVKGILMADEIIVAQNLVLDNGALICKKLVVYGDVLGSDQGASEGTACIAGEVAPEIDLEDQGMVMGEKPVLPDETRHMVLVTMVYK